MIPYAEMATQKPKILIVVGPTASGKTSLAVSLAKDLGGEVISADSRQVYRHLDLGTAKITTAEMEGIPHHLIDCVEPADIYTSTDWVNDTKKLIEDITKRGKVPIIAGGTFLYIDLLLGKKSAPKVPPNPALRAVLEKKTNDELFTLLRENDPARAEKIDRHNPRRLVRALEIVDALGIVPPTAKTDSPYDTYIIGLTHDTKKLKERIFTRLTERIDKGLVAETQHVLASCVDENRLNEIGLEYKVVLSHLHGELTESEMRQKLKEKVWQYAKRQLTWLKKMENVHWFSPDDYAHILKEVTTFLKS